MKSLTHSALLLGALMLTSGSLQAAIYDLCVGETTLEVTPGNFVPMWGYGLDPSGTGPCDATVPGPLLDVPVGESLSVNLRNTLVGHATSIMIPGQGMPDVGGTAVTFTPAGDTRARVRSFVSETPAGNTVPVEYTWNNIRPGSYGYQSGTHVAVQVQMGLYGAMIKNQSEGVTNEAYPGISYDQDLVLLYSAIDPVLHDQVSTGAYGTTGMTSTINYNPQYFLVNGQSYGVGDLPLPAGAPGSTTLLRMINMDINTHAPTLIGSYMDVVAESGYPYPFARQQYSVNLAPSQAKDALLSVGQPGTLSLFDRRLYGTGGSLVSMLQVGGDPVANDPLYYFSFFRWLGAGGETVVPGLGNVQNRDVVSYNPLDGSWAMVLDGSDTAYGANGLVRANGTTMANIDALHVFTDGRMFLSFDTPTQVPGIGTVDDSDIVVFNPDSNSFGLAYSGASLDLTTNPAEDIDALSVDVNGDLLVSTVGPFKINGVVISRDEDVSRFNLATQSWAIMFDSSNLSTEFTDDKADIDALAFPAMDQLLLSIQGGQTPLVGVKARDEDVLLFTPDSFGKNNTAGLLATLLDMTKVTNSLPGNADISAMSFTRVSAP